MGKFKDLKGLKFNYWTVIKPVGKNSSGQIKWECICDCGTISIVDSVTLTHNRSKSCGCYRIESQSKRASKHRATIRKKKDRLYSIWSGMKYRCYNKNNSAYKWYGAKGITVCEDWFLNYECFKDWSLNNGYNDNLTIDRIDNYKGYSPENCQWITNEENAKKHRNTIWITINGISESLRGWARILNVPHYKIIYMLNSKGMEYTENYIKENYPS